MMLLAGDIGGTKTRLAIYEFRAGKFNLVTSNQFTSIKYPSLDVIIEEFLKGSTTKIESACFGIAGPIQDGRVKLSNLPWVLDQRLTAKTLGITRCSYINDLVATASGVPVLSPTDFKTLHPGSSGSENMSWTVMAPGTGLGQAILHKHKDEYLIYPSEGGHVEFAPRNALEYELFFYLQKKFTRVSIERVASGMGIVNIYNFLRETKRFSEPQELHERFGGTVQAKIISEAAIKSEFPICVETMNIMISLLGSHAGNLVLTFLSMGGVYLGGGIPPKIEPLLATEVFLEAYTNKGRMSDLVRKAPVYLIKNDYAALLGAARIASMNGL